MRTTYALRKVVVAVFTAVAVVSGVGVASADSRDQYRASSPAQDTDPEGGWCHCGDPT